MPTEKYLSLKEDFRYEFGVDFNIDAYQTLQHKLKSILTLITNTY